jgi:hypothetical protein
MKKLNNNILALKYSSTGNHIPTYQPIEISDELKSIIKNMHEEHESDEDVSKLSFSEKRILARLKQHLRSPSIHNDLDENFVENFEVCLGNFEAGNDSQLLKNTLKDYVKVALHEGIITQHVASNILSKL